MFCLTALVVAYDYHPGSETLEAKYVVGMAKFVPESVLWSYISQIVSALQSIHAAGLAARVINPSKILLTGKNRIRINCVGVFDLLNYDSANNVKHYQQEDLVGLGKLILSLACKSSMTIQTLPKSLEYVSTNYSSDLKNLLILLLTKSSHTHSYPTIEDVAAMTNPHLFREIEYLHNYTDMLESEFSKEVENGRLFRLLVKLGFINERPEFGMDANWSETGDRYLLKLFRDYLFHQVSEDGNPAIDFAHVVDCLNKLDVGVSEKILLTSRDKQSILVVSYQDLKQRMEQTFNELLSPKLPPTHSNNNNIVTTQYNNNNNTTQYNNTTANHPQFL